MTDGLNCISVRVIRLNPDNLEGEPLLEGSGTLFEDKESYYVLTAFHCLEKEVDGRLIAKDLDFTRISFSYQRKKINVDIIGLVDDNKEKDWALLAVHQPDVDWSFAGKVKLTTQVQVGTTYESYPYVHDYGDRGRYALVIPTNEYGDCHIADDLTTGRYNADLLMKGGSGAGVMLNIDGVLHCFGFMKETLPQGKFNDVRTVCVDDILPLLSKEVHKSFTKEELLHVKADVKKLQLEQYAKQLDQGKDYESLKKILAQLLGTTIPMMIDSLQDEQAMALLDLVEKNCSGLLEDDATLNAQYLYNYSQYYRLIQNIDKAREFAHRAFELDGKNPKYVESEARKLWNEGNKEASRHLLSMLPEDNLFKLAVRVFEAKDPQVAFMALHEIYRQSYRFRYYLLDLYNNVGYPSWIVQGIELKEPETLTLSLLPEWVFLFTSIHCRMQGIIPLSFSSYMPTQELKKGFDAGWTYFGLAKGTKLEKAIPILSALYYYWGFLLKNEKEEWYKEFLNVNIKTDNEINRRFYTIMKSSMLSMMKKYDDAYKCVISADIYPNDMIWALVAGLSVFAKNTDYLNGLVEYSKQFDFVADSPISEALVFVSQSIHYENLKGFYDSLKFKNDYEKKLLIDFNKINSGYKVTADGYETFINDLTGLLPAVAASVIYDTGDKERALSYLKSKFEPGKGSALENAYFSLLSKDNEHQLEYYNHLKNKRDSGEPLTPLELKQYYNYSLTLFDYEEALRVVIEIREANGNDEYSFSSYIDLIGKCKPEELLNHYKEVIEYPFQISNLVIVVYLAYATNNYLEKAAEILYKHAIRMQDDRINDYYIDQTLRGFIAGVANETGNKVIEDKYVAYSIEGTQYCKRVSPNTKLGAAMLGKMKGETIEVELSGEKKSITIDNIYNKYGYLHYTLLKNIMDMGGNDYLHPLKVPELDTPKAAELFIKQLEDINRESKEAYNKALEKYKHGDNGLFALVDINDIVSSYYKLLFSSFEIQLKPYAEYDHAIIRMMIHKKHRCVLDITSLLLLFEFSNYKGGIIYKERFILPRYLFQIIVEFQKRIPIMESYDFVKAMEEGCLYRFSENPSEDVRLRFQALVDWMKQNCDIVTNPTILNVDADLRNNPNAMLFQHTYVELMDLNEPRLILTEDSFMRMVMNIPLIVSTEVYIYSVEGPVLGKDFSEFLVKNHNRYV